MSARNTAVETARRILAETEDVSFLDAEAAAHAVGTLRGAVRGLLSALEAQPRSARLSAQADEEFVSLARAARTEIHAMRGALDRLDRFEQALTAMLTPGGGDGR